jgi:hypothetical protein
MMRKLLSFLVLLVLTFPCFAQIKLDKENCVENIDPGYCAWCCLETLGRHHRIESLYNLVENRSKESDFKTWDEKNKQWVQEPYVWINYGTYLRKEHRSPGSAMAIRNKLNSLKVKYKLQEDGNFDKGVIKDAIWGKTGCIIAVNDWTHKTMIVHAILITNYDSKEITFFDPNDIKHNYAVSWEWLDRYWTGYAIMLEIK